MQSRKKARKLAGEELFANAVKLLGIRSCSSQELKAKLRLKAAVPADVDAAIARLKEIGYLNDEKFAENFASTRRENEGFGKFRVLTDLRKRRVPTQLAEQAVQQAFEGTDEAILLEQFIERRMPSLTSGPIEDERKLAAAYRKLRRAGFKSGLILAALKRVSARTDSFEEPVEEEDPG